MPVQRCGAGLAPFYETFLACLELGEELHQAHAPRSLSPAVSVAPSRSTKRARELATIAWKDTGSAILATTAGAPPEAPGGSARARRSMPSSPS